MSDKRELSRHSHCRKSHAFKMAESKQRSISSFFKRKGDPTTAKPAKKSKTDDPATLDISNHDEEMPLSVVIDEEDESEFGLET